MENEYVTIFDKYGINNVPQIDDAIAKYINDMFVELKTPQEILEHTERCTKTLCKSVRDLTFGENDNKISEYEIRMLLVGTVLGMVVQQISQSINEQQKVEQVSTFLTNMLDTIKNFKVDKKPNIKPRKRKGPRNEE